MDNVVTALFSNESDAVRAFSELKNNYASDSCMIPQIALVKKQNDQIIPLDSFNATAAEDSVTGGLIGLFVGIIGGPLGVLLAGSAGALIGGAVESHENKKSRSLVEYVSNELGEGMIALVALARETSPDILNAMLGVYNVAIFRTEAAVVAQEVEDAKELQKELAKEAKKQSHAEKKEAHHEKVEAKRQRIHDHFESFKERHFHHHKDKAEV